MYPQQHAAVSVGATFTVAWAGGVGPPWSVVGWTVLGGTLIDVIEQSCTRRSARSPTICVAAHPAAGEAL